jgi:hypothetical protein
VGNCLHPGSRPREYAAIEAVRTEFLIRNVVWCVCTSDQDCIKSGALQITHIGNMLDQNEIYLWPVPDSKIPPFDRKRRLKWVQDCIQNIEISNPE